MTEPATAAGRRRIDDGSVLDAVPAGHPADSGNVAVTGEVADRLDCHHSTALRHLKRLRETDAVEGVQKAGGWLWWRPMEGPTDE